MQAGVFWARTSYVLRCTEFLRIETSMTKLSVNSKSENNNKCLCRLGQPNDAGFLGFPFPFRERVMPHGGVPSQDVCHFKLGTCSLKPTTHSSCAAG